MDCHGRMLAHVLLHESDGIVSMSWNCPDFLVEDSTESDTDSDDNILPLGTNTVPLLIKTTCYLLSSSVLTFVLFLQVRRVKPLLTVTFLSGDISLMNNYDDLSPAVIRSGLKGRKKNMFFSSMPLSCVDHVTHKTHISCTPSLHRC